MTEKLQNPFEIGELITAVNSTIDDVNEKQDTLIAGTNVTIENNVISAKGSIDNVDGVTAIVNENDILQVTGMLEKNTGDAVFDWIGTKEEYDLQDLANTHPDWICFITDDAQDTSDLLEQVNTVKNELTTKADTTTVNNLVYPIGTNNWNNAEQWIYNILSTLYPIGAIYIGTQNTCPLASLISSSQWELISTNLITDVNNTASLSVYGNGKAIGVYSDNIGVGGLTSHGDYGSVGIKVGNYNTTASGTASRVGWNHGVALSTDASTSGITGTANISSTKLTVNVWRRTA